MTNINIMDIYPYTQISQRNSKAWKIVLDRVKGCTDDEIIVDTKGLYVENPTSNMDFRKLMGDKRVKLILHNSSELAGIIRIYLLSCGYDADRVINEGVIEEIAVNEVAYKENLVKDFIDIMEQDGSEVYINVSKRVTQISSESTLESLVEAIRRKVKANDGQQIRKVVVDFNSIFIRERILASIHTNLKELSNDVSITIANLCDTKAFNDIKNEDEGFNSSMSLKEKWNIFKECIPKGTVGFLCRYKNTRRVDVLGRHGDGIPIWSRFAIFKGVRKGDTKVRLVFDVYKIQDFYTKIHQQMEFEDKDPSLTPMRFEMYLEQIGILDKFTGTDYHFNYPIQYKDEDSIYMRTIQRFGDDYGTVYGRVRLPEVAKYVLDDFNIPYNKEKLDYAIQETNKILIENKSAF